MFLNKLTLAETQMFFLILTKRLACMYARIIMYHVGYIFW